MTPSRFASLILLGVGIVVQAAPKGYAQTVSPTALIEMAKAGDFASHGLPEGVTLCRPPQARRSLAFQLIRAGQASGVVTTENDSESALQTYTNQLQQALAGECNRS